MINILVCISIVPDTTSKLTIDPSTNKIDKRSLTMVIGPYDDYALSKAVEIKESKGGNLTVLYVGDDSAAEQILRKCLAIGADDAFRVNTSAISSRQIASEIIHFAKEKKYDLIMMGKEAIDTNGGIIHRMVAHGLSYNHFNPVMHLDVNSSEKANAKVEIENGSSELEINLPAVLGCQEPIAEWKIPSMRGIMMARTKPLIVLDPIFPVENDHKNDEVVEKNRLQKVFTPSDISEVIDIINHLK